MSKGRIWRCSSLLGFLFGHKFIKSMGGYTWPSEHCYRCGMPRGGYRIKEKETV